MASPVAINDRPPLTASPWFWLHLFSAAALAGLLIIGPKYEAREAGIEAKHRNRQHAAQRGKLPLAHERSASTPPNQQRSLLVPLWTLGIALGIVHLVASVGLVVSRRVTYRRLAEAGHV